MILHNSLKTYYNGTHRAMPVRQTRQNVIRKIRHSGLPVYERIIRIDDVDTIGMPVYAASHNNKFNNCRLPSWGKGVTDDLSYVSALMERVERYSASDIDVWRKEIIYSDRKRTKGEYMISRWDFVPCNL